MRRGDDGLVGGVDGLVFGVLVFVFGTLVVVNAWGVVDAKSTVVGAAREAARAFVEAPDATSAVRAARHAADEAVRAMGRDPARAGLEVTGVFRRCGRVTATVRYDLALRAVPVLGLAGRAITVSGRHSEVVDPYRSGTAVGVADCR